MSKNILVQTLTILKPKVTVNHACVLPVFEGCSVDTIMVVAVGCPATNDCVEAVGTSVPWGVVITNPAKRKRETVIWLSIWAKETFYMDFFGILGCPNNLHYRHCQNFKATKILRKKLKNKSHSAKTMVLSRCKLFYKLLDQYSLTTCTIKLLLITCYYWYWIQRDFYGFKEYCSDQDL